MNLRLAVATCSFLLSVGCSSSDASLLVYLRTDMIPGVDFSAVRTEIVDTPSGAAMAIEPRTHAVFLGDDLLEGARVAQFLGLEHGRHAIRVRLLDAMEQPVMERVAIAEVKKLTGITVVMTRDCRGVMCPGAGDEASAIACLGGRCVPPECLPESPEACPAASCGGDVECALPPADCATAVCVFGLCLASQDPSACGASEYCDPELGCRPVSGGMEDAGVDAGFDAGFDAGLDAGFDAGLDTGPAPDPVVIRTAINEGAALATSRTLGVSVEVSGGEPPLEVRVAEAHPMTGVCTFGEDGFVPIEGQQGGLQLTVSPVSIDRKVCAWARDARGRVTQISPATGTDGVDVDSIAFDLGEPPVVSVFDVTNAASGPNLGTRTYAAGDPVRIEWTVTDAEGLAAAPVNLYVTVDGQTWTLLGSGLGDAPGEPLTSSGTYLDFVAPSAGFFRLKLVAWDASEQSSVPALSDSQNTPGWSVYLGSTDRGLGGTALSAAIRAARNEPHLFAIDPMYGRAALMDDGFGLVILEPDTGRVYRLLRQGDGNNLPVDGPLPPDPMYWFRLAVKFDSKGRLYVLPMGGGLGDGSIYQIDLDTGWCRRYAGGGLMAPADGAPATALQTMPSAMAFDEDDNLYFLANCTPGLYDSTTGTVRIMKATQNPDGSSGTTTAVAGNCVRGAVPDGPVDALLVPLLSAGGVGLGTIAVWDRGARLYYKFYTASARKVIDGLSYRANIPTANSANLAYDPVRRTILAGRGALEEHVPYVSGNLGETATVVAGHAASGAGCYRDGFPAAQACTTVNYGIDVTPNGRIFFADGGNHKGHGEYRVRYVDINGDLRTYAGTPALIGDGGHRRHVRTQVQGIAYKDASAPNQAAFPEGLYFMDHGGAVMAYVDPVTDVVEVLAGNQSDVAVFHPSGTPLSPEMTLGVSYFGGNMRAIAFDDQGLPWFRYGAFLASVSAQREIVARQQGGGFWWLAVDGDDPRDRDSSNYGFSRNITFKGEGVFFVGGSGGNASSSSVSYFDYATNMVTRVLGAPPATPASLDDPTPGSAVALHTHGECAASANCYPVYRADEDRLYFSEQDKIRYVQNPTDPATSSLQTFLDMPGTDWVRNFIFSPAGDELFYVRGGQLHGHDLGSGALDCDDSALGPPAGLETLGSLPNQLAWMGPGASTLLVSSGEGDVFRFDR